MNRLSPIEVGRPRIRNRMVCPPYFSNTTSVTGEARLERIERDANHAEGTGLIIVEQAGIQSPWVR